MGIKRVKIFSKSSDEEQEDQVDSGELCCSLAPCYSLADKLCEFMMSKGVLPKL